MSMYVCVFMCAVYIYIKKSVYMWARSLWLHLVLGPEKILLDVNALPIKTAAWSLVFPFLKSTISSWHSARDCYSTTQQVVLYTNISDVVTDPHWLRSANEDVNDPLIMEIQRLRSWSLVMNSELMIMLNAKLKSTNNSLTFVFLWSRCSRAQWCTSKVASAVTLLRLRANWCGSRFWGIITNLSKY